MAFLTDLPASLDCEGKPNHCPVPSSILTVMMAFTQSGQSTAIRVIAENHV